MPLAKLGRFDLGEDVVESICVDLVVTAAMTRLYGRDWDICNVVGGIQVQSEAGPCSSDRLGSS